MNRAAAALVLLVAGCIDTRRIAVATTADVLTRGQRAMKMESDYELAAGAMPASLKTVESFHVAYPDIRKLTVLLAEGYCQYGSGFVEDEWEIAYLVRGDVEEADRRALRATRMYARCMNYGLELLDPRWARALGGKLQDFREVARPAAAGEREGMLWLALGLTSMINMNVGEVSMVSYLPFAQYLLERLVVMDGDAAVILGGTDPAARAALARRLGEPRGAPDDPVRRALPHLALGMMLTSRGAAVGGDPARGRRHFERAIELTGGRFLLAKVMMARGHARVVQDRTRFRDILVDVLRTDPAVWPDQRLANEIAHRRARRYLALIDDWF